MSPASRANARLIVRAAGFLPQLSRANMLLSYLARWSTAVSSYTAKTTGLDSASLQQNQPNMS